MLLSKNPCLFFTSRKIKDLRRMREEGASKTTCNPGGETKAYPVKKKTDKPLIQFLGTRPA